MIRRIIAIPGLLYPDAIVRDVQVVQDVIGFAGVQDLSHSKQALEKLSPSCTHIVIYMIENLHISLIFTLMSST